MNSFEISLRSARRRRRSTTFSVPGSKMKLIFFKKTEDFNVFSKFASEYPRECDPREWEFGSGHPREFPRFSRVTRENNILCIGESLDKPRQRDDLRTFNHKSQFDFVITRQETFELGSVGY